MPSKLYIFILSPCFVGAWMRASDHISGRFVWYVPPPPIPFPSPPSIPGLAICLLLSSWDHCREPLHYNTRGDKVSTPHGRLDNPCPYITVELPSCFRLSSIRCMQSTSVHTEAAKKQKALWTTLSANVGKSLDMERTKCECPTNSFHV